MKKIMLGTATWGLVLGALFANFQKGQAEAEPLPISRSNSPSEPSERLDPGVMGPRRQLTFQGPRAGEGYFSADGRKMIFQSERDEKNPFYQIFSMDLENGQTEILSSGKGKTTCAWFHPSMKKALFSSTHQDPALGAKVKEEFESRKSKTQKKYSWSYDDSFDIFEVDLRTKKLKALTHAKGYDAEGSYSPDGRSIVFASNRLAYAEKMSAEDQKLFEQDPSFMMDIYSMKADGSNVKRLTTAKGYDGGPFFSADGEWITWRRFAPNGQTAEIMKMRKDGSQQQALTKMGAMSWAPFFHPSGDYVIFTSNVLGFENFELYIVDGLGEKEPVRVSYIPGFDGLPVFSPNGQKLSWTHRSENGESQIYIADWDDRKARSLLKLAPRSPASFEELGDYAPADAKRWVEYLASDALQGRMTGSPEEKIYTQKIADSFKSMGLAPPFKEGYLQPFEFTSGVKLGSAERLNFKIKNDLITPKVGEDYSPLSFSSSGQFEEAGSVFAGYGIVAPASEAQKIYDSYAALDVKGKWVIAFRDVPLEVDGGRRAFLNTYSRPHHKALVARERGAKGLILVAGPNSGSRQKIMALRFEGAGFAGAGLPVLSLSDRIAERLLSPLGKNLKSLQDELDRGQMTSGELPDLRINAEIDLQSQKATGSNVLALLKVPGATETLVIGAHGDHLGKGLAGNSLATANESSQIHYGADDNASGVAAVLQIAEAMTRAIKAGSFKPKQNILFAIWSGEEIGLLGSSHFLKDNKLKISSYLNMDMIGRLRESLILQGTASAKEWTALIEKQAAASKLPLALVSDPFVPSDAMAFYMKGIPSLHFFTGAHGEYHTPRDTPDLINYEGLSRIARLVGRMAEDLSRAPKSKLTYVKVESAANKDGASRGFRIFLGTIPDYTQEGVKGVKISGTSKNSPAEQAGLMTGDIIVELAGTKIENLYDYVYALQSLKPKESVKIKVQRQESLKDLAIVPALKE